MMTARMRNRAALLAAAVALAGCTAVLTDVTPIGQDAFQVGANNRSGNLSKAEMTSVVLKRANEYCAAQGKTMELIDAKAVGTQGWTTVDSEAKFKCVAK